MKKGMRERVNGGDVCDCCFGEQLDSMKPFRPLYIFKHMLKNNFVPQIRRLSSPKSQISIWFGSPLSQQHEKEAVHLFLK
jgi:hypothetical protein